jgi:uncharacterized cupredoxin-like copper-binding protein
VKRRNGLPPKKLYASISPQLIVKLLILVFALLVVAGIGIGASITTHHSTPAASAAHSTLTPPEDTITFADIKETPAAGSVKVSVTLAEFTITSSVKTFHAGIPYYFVIANRGHVVHEFTILPDKPDGTPLPVASQYESKIIEIEQIAPGTTMTVNLTFSPSIVGRYEIACMMRGHYLAGMRLPIVITR